MTLGTLAPNWDIVVVGAGIAGSAAALRLARRGAAVLLVEKSAWPRDKVCGGCINAAALQELENCGVRGLETAGRLYTRMHLGCQGREASLGLPAGRAVTRRRLDARIAAEAMRAGAEFLPATHARLGPVTDRDRSVTLSQGAGSATLKARLVLDCSGLGERLARGSGPPASRVAAGAYIGAGTVSSGAPAFYRPGAIHMACAAHGYAGLVRAEDDRINIGAALDPTWVKRAGGPGEAVATTLEQAGFPAWPALREARWRGTPKLTRSRRRLGAERLFVLGDAAGYVEPFTGEGIGWALADAAALEALALAGAARWSSAFIEEWSAIHRNLLGRRQRVCRAVTRILRHPRLLAGALPLVDRAPGALAPLVRWLNHAYEIAPVQAR